MDPLACLLSFGLHCAPAAPEGPTGPGPGAPPAVAPEGPEAPGGTGSAGATPSGSASELLATVQVFHAGVKDLEASFRQTYVHPVYGTKTESSGRVRIKRPGFMVWDYAKDADPDFYADGATLAVVERDTRQVVKRDVKGSDFAGAVEFLFGGRGILQDFFVRWAPESSVSRYGLAGHRLVELMPKAKNANYSRLLLAVDDKGRVGAFVVRNSDGSTNHFILSAVRVDQGLADSAFTLQVPAGYVVVEE